MILFYQTNVFNLERKYQILECTIYPLNIFSGEIGFYGDNGKVLQKVSVDKNNFYQKVKLDVTNIGQLTIQTRGPSVIAEPYLY